MRVMEVSELNNYYICEDDTQVYRMEDQISTWMLGNFEDAKQNLGEDIVYAVQEVLDYE